MKSFMESPYLEPEEDSFLVEAAEGFEIPHLHEEQRHLGLVQLGLGGGKGELCQSYI